MENNPFRKNPSTNIQGSVEDWGKIKFKPTKFGNEKKSFKKHPSGGNRNFNNKKGKHFRQNKTESLKFNEVARNAKPETATPWNKYKNDILFKHRDDEQAALQANMDTSEAKLALKQREMNYRKCMEQKKQEITKWEDFDEENIGIQKNKDSNDNEDFNLNKKSNKKHVNKNRKNEDHKFNMKSTTNFKKKIAHSDKKPFLSKSVLDKFDSKKLSYKQNDKLRSAITKATILASGGGNLEKYVKDMKKKIEKRKAQ